MSDIVVVYKTGFFTSGWAGRMTSPIFSALCHFSCTFWILWFMALITGEVNSLARLIPACCSVLWTQMDTSIACVCAQGLLSHLPLRAPRLEAAQGTARVRVLLGKIPRADKHLPSHSPGPFSPLSKMWRYNLPAQRSPGYNFPMQCNITNKEVIRYKPKLGTSSKGKLWGEMKGQLQVRAQTQRSLGKSSLFSCHILGW